MQTYCPDPRIGLKTSLITACVSPQAVFFRVHEHQAGAVMEFPHDARSIDLLLQHSFNTCKSVGKIGEATMSKMKLLAGVWAAAILAGCQMIPAGQTVAEYCANSDNADEAVCKLKVEIDGNSTALADTNMSLSEARSMADSATRAAAAAQASADAAQASADAAMSLAESKQVQCETRTIQNTDTGTCRPGYSLTSCTQTRYTTRAGGLSFLREINDEKCRFNSRVLEMQVRCCAVSGSAPTPVDALIENEVMPEVEEVDTPQEMVPVSP